MPEDTPKNEKTAGLPATPTIPFPSKTGQRAAPILQDTPGFRAAGQPLDAIKGSDRGIFVAVIAVLAILIAFGAAYWWLRG
jgi:hypothetical protein